MVEEVEAAGEEEGDGVVVEGKPKKVAIVLCKKLAAVYLQLKVLDIFAKIEGAWCVSWFNLEDVRRVL